MCRWSGKQPPPLQHRVAEVSEKRAQLGSWAACSPDLSETVSSQVTCKFLQWDAGMKDYSDTVLLGPVNMWTCTRCRWVCAESNLTSILIQGLLFPVSSLLTLELLSDAMRTHLLSIMCQNKTYLELFESFFFATSWNLYCFHTWWVSVCSAECWKCTYFLKTQKCASRLFTCYVFFRTKWDTFRYSVSVLSVFWCLTVFLNLSKWWPELPPLCETSDC